MVPLDYAKVGWSNEPGPQSTVVRQKPWLAVTKGVGVVVSIRALASCQQSQPISSVTAKIPGALDTNSTHKEQSKHEPLAQIG